MHHFNVPKQRSLAGLTTVFFVLVVGCSQEPNLTGMAFEKIAELHSATDDLERYRQAFEKADIQIKVLEDSPVAEKLRQAIQVHHAVRAYVNLKANQITEIQFEDGRAFVKNAAVDLGEEQRLELGDWLGVAKIAAGQYELADTDATVALNVQSAIDALLTKSRGLVDDAKQMDQ